MAVDGGIARQIDIGHVAGVCNAARAVPRLIGHVGMAGMVARNDAAAAEAVRMRRLRRGVAVQRRRLILRLWRLRALLGILPAILLGVGIVLAGILGRLLGVVLAGIVQIVRIVRIAGIVHVLRIQRAVVRVRALRAADRALRVHLLRRAGGLADAQGRALRFLPLGQSRRRQQGQNHAAQKQTGEQSFFHGFSSLSFSPCSRQKARPHRSGTQAGARFLGVRTSIITQMRRKCNRNPKKKPPCFSPAARAGSPAEKSEAPPPVSYFGMIYFGGTVMHNSIDLVCPRRKRRHGGLAMPAQRRDAREREHRYKALGPAALRRLYAERPGPVFQRALRLRREHAGVRAARRPERAAAKRGRGGLFPSRPGRRLGCSSSRRSADDAGRARLAGIVRADPFGAGKALRAPVPGRAARMPDGVSVFGPDDHAGVGRSAF